MTSGLKTTRRLKLIVVFVFLCLVAGAFWRSGATAESVVHQAPTPTPAAAKPAAEKPAAPAAAKPVAKEPQIEGCVKCHNNIEPMHRYNSSGDVFEKIDKNGQDAQGLTCTSCHGGNPVATTQREAHVQP